MQQFVSVGEAHKITGLHPHTLRKYVDDGTIRSIKTPGGKRQLDLSSILPQQPKSCCTICYARVSTNNQKQQLDTQKQVLSIKYPGNEIISDIGSGLNFKRKGLNSILERALSGESITVVCTYKDRLARFGVEIIEKILEKSGGKLVVLNQVDTSPVEELTADLIAIITCFSSRIHGLRSHKNKKVILKAIKETESSSEEVVGDLQMGIQQNCGNNGKELP
jgi:predicted site-specific integrase-resolvase